MGTLHGSVRCVVTVRAGEASVREVVTSVRGVQSVLTLLAAEAGDNIVTLQVDSQVDVRPQLCHALVSAGISVLELGAEARELELVFLELAKQDRANDKSPSNRSRQAAGSVSATAKGAAAPGEPGGIR